MCPYKPNLDREALEAMAILGGSQSSGIHQEGCQDHQGTSRGILNAIILKASNGVSESINSRINMIKIRSRGFRNKARYRSAIYFHLGGRWISTRKVLSDEF